jgi:RimJ/RimL family protein N-acetyltransferase
VSWQPTLVGERLLLRPLTEADFEPLLAAASDPLIWAQHPQQDRHRREVFEAYFRSGMESGGALAILEKRTGRMIGSSRFYNQGESFVEIGYTFLIREHWGGASNRELKTLMLEHAFRAVETVYFVAGLGNLRSQKAISKLGANRLTDVRGLHLRPDLSQSAVFSLTRDAWRSR